MPNLRSIRSEPAGAIYLSLLAFAEGHSSTFSLVWRKQLVKGANADNVRADLEPFLDAERETDTWPGTTLLGHTAIVRSYRMCADSARLLATAKRLYAWEAPARPEDLAFYTPGGRWWFGSISHERDSFVDLDAIDVVRLAAAVPGLRLEK
jgi:hypothetical protein